MGYSATGFHWHPLLFVQAPVVGELELAVPAAELFEVPEFVAVLKKKRPLFS